GGEGRRSRVADTADNNVCATPGGASDHSADIPVGRAADFPAGERETGRMKRLLLIAFVISGLVCAVAAWLLWKEMRPSWPQVDLRQLDTGSAALIQRHLDVVRASPESGAAWGQLGAFLASFEFRAAARQCFVRAERLDPTQPRWPYLHGRLLWSEGVRAALDELRRAATLCGTQPDAPRLRLAQWLAEAGQWEAAQAE